MGRVVMVTGVSRYLGGRFTQLLQADPDISRVIGVDVVPPKADLGDAGVRARRHPQPGHRQGHRPGRGRHRRAHGGDRHPAWSRRPGDDEGDQRHRHDAAAGGVPEGARACASWWSSRRPPSTAPRRRTRRCSPRTSSPTPWRAVGLRQGLRRGRGLRARLRPPPARRRGDHAAVRQLRRAQGADCADLLLQPAGGAHRARLRPAAAARARAGRPGGALAQHARTTTRARSTSPGTAS